MPEPRIEWRKWHGLEALYLGDIIVGRVAPDGGRGNKPRYILNLDNVESAAFWFTSRSVEQAKARVERRLAEWLERAGLQ